MALATSAGIRPTATTAVSEDGEARSRAAAHLGGAVWSAVVTSTAVLAAFAAVTEVNHWFVFALLLVVILGLAYEVFLTDSANGGRLGHEPTARCAAAAAVATCFAAWGTAGYDDWVAAVGVILAAGAILIEPALAKAA